MTTSVTPFLWFDNNIPEAVAFYKSVFPNAKVETVNDFMASFELEGQKFHALNGGPKYKFNEAIFLHKRRDAGRGKLFLGQAGRRRRRGSEVWMAQGQVWPVLAGCA